MPMITTCTRRSTLILAIVDLTSSIAPGLAQQIQNHKRAEDHQDNLETFLQALPDERVIRRDVFLERCAGDVKYVKARISVQTVRSGQPFLPTGETPECRPERRRLD